MLEVWGCILILVLRFRINCHMKKKLYAVGTLVLALAISGLPTMAFARDGVGGEGDDMLLQVKAQVQEGEIHANTYARVDDLEDRKGKQDSRDQIGAPGSGDEMDIEAMTNGQAFEDDADEIHFDLEDDDEDSATSFNDLKQKIEMRKQQLDQEVASTSQNHKEIVENANPVRLAVHSLLVSKDLLGGIGPKVSEIAKDMNNSVATTTNAEAKIQSRGFLARLFFGGDSAAADVIAQQVAQNQQRIDDLNQMLSEANVSTDIQATLHAQITAIQEAQARLQDLAQREQKQWGLFSWRF